MNVRRLLIGIVSAIVAIVVADRLLTRIADTLPPAVAGSSERVDVDGTGVSMVETGPPDAPVVVFIHGPYLGASAREFAAVSNAMVDTNRVLLIDLPGFGRSDRPNQEYDIEYLGDVVASVLEDRTDDPIVVTSGQAYPIALAASDRTPIERIVAIGPRTKRDTSAPLLGSLLRVPVIGTALSLALTSKPMLSMHLSDTLEVPDGSITADFLSYTWQSAHQPGSRPSTAAWIAGDLDAIDSLETLATETSVDQAFIIGENAEHPTLDAVRSIATDTGSSLSVVSDTGAFPHIEAPDVVADHLNSSELLSTV